MIPNYSMIPAAAIRRSPAIQGSIRSMDFDKPKVYVDTSITDGLVYKLDQVHLASRTQHIDFVIHCLMMRVPGRSSQK